MCLQQGVAVLLLAALACLREEANKLETLGISLAFADAVPCFRTLSKHHHVNLHFACLRV